MRHQEFWRNKCLHGECQPPRNVSVIRKLASRKHPDTIYFKLQPFILYLFLQNQRSTSRSITRRKTMQVGIILLMFASLVATHYISLHICLALDDCLHQNVVYNRIKKSSVISRQKRFVFSILTGRPVFLRKILYTEPSAFRPFLFMTERQLMFDVGISDVGLPVANGYSCCL